MGWGGNAEIDTTELGVLALKLRGQISSLIIILCNIKCDIILYLLSIKFTKISKFRLCWGIHLLVIRCAKAHLVLFSDLLTPRLSGRGYYMEPRAVGFPLSGTCSPAFIPGAALNQVFCLGLPEMRTPA